MTTNELFRLQEAAAYVAEYTARRDDLIRKARADGASLRAIADAVGLSHQTVANICDR